MTDDYAYDNGNVKIKIFPGVGTTIRTPEEEERLQRWQRAKFARELGFKEDTTDITELPAIDKKYEDMLQELNEWNEVQQAERDIRAKALLRLQAKEITFEEYEKILFPHKGVLIRCPPEWGGHGEHYNNLFYCYNDKCKREFCLYDEDGKQIGMLLKLCNDDGELVEIKALCPHCREYNEERKRFREKIGRK